MNRKRCSRLLLLTVALDKGGNPNTVTRNNAADNFTDDPIPGTASHNFVGQREPKTLKDLLRDPDNWDSRPRADAVELIDQGTPVTCSVNGQTIDVTAGYNGDAPDIGAYEYGDTNYWIPGRIVPQASMPVPPSGNQNVKLDADLMWLGGKDATSYDVYFGTEPGNLTFQGSQTNNIFSPGPLAPDTVYYWRIDSVGPDGTVTGDVWTADTTVIARDPVDTRSRESVAPKYGPDQETMERFLQRMKAKAKKKGKEFDKEMYEKGFNELDANKDGILTREERRAFWK